MTKTLTRVLGEGTFWTTFSTIIVKVVSFCTIFLTLKTLTVYEYGVAELAIAAIGFLGFFQLPGLSAVVVADIGVEKGRGNLARAKGIFWSYVRIQTLVASVAFILIFFGARFLSAFYPEHITRYFHILAFTFPLSVVGSAFSTLFVVTFRYLVQSINSFLLEGFKLIVLAISFFVFGLKVEAVLYGIVLSQALTFLVQFPAARRAYRELGHDTPEKVSIWRMLYAHGKWSVFSSYLGSFGSNARTYIIKLFLGTETVALYAVATGLVGHTSALFPVSNVVTPILPQFIAQRDRFMRLISKTAKYQFLGYLALTAVALIAIPPVIVLIFPQYEAAMPFYRVMLFGMIPSGLTGVFTAVFFAFKAQRNLFFAVVVKTVATVVFTSLFAKYFGAMGIAYAYIVVTCVYGFERYRATRVLMPEYRFNIRNTFAIDDIDRLILGKIKTWLLKRLPILSR